MNACNICGHNDFIFNRVFNQYPVGNIYSKYPVKNGDYCSDLSLVQCKCGHVMAKSSIPLADLYSENYAYINDSTGVIARRCIGFNFLKKNLILNKFNLILDIGCGQLDFLRLIKSQFFADKYIGIDPVALRESSSSKEIEFIHSNFKGDLIPKTDGTKLIVCDQVLEHIIDLSQFIFDINQMISENDFVYICVPSFDIIQNKLQFQEVIHEHVNYFTLQKINELFSKNGYSVIESISVRSMSRGYNYHLFRKTSKNEITNLEPRLGPLNLNHLFHRYETLLDICRDHIEELNEPVVGICASELTPTLAYHMKTDLGFCTRIYDTSFGKDKKYMPTIKPRIEFLDRIDADQKNFYYFVTAPIISSQVISFLSSKEVKNIIVPINIF